MVTLNKLIPCHLQHGEEGYAIIVACGNELSIILSSIEDPDHTICLGSWTRPSHIVCLDAECISSSVAIDTSAACELRLVVGLADGTVLSQVFAIAEPTSESPIGATDPVPTLELCGTLQGSVSMVQLGTGFVLASCDAETALFYPASGVGSDRQPEWVKAAVDLVSATLQEPFFTAGSADTFVTRRSCPTCAVILPDEQGSSEMKEDQRDQCMLLLGCADGTVWSLHSPLRSAVLQLHASYGTARAQVEPMIVQAEIWETFPHGVVKLLLVSAEPVADSALDSDDSTAAGKEQISLSTSVECTLTVVEEDGRCMLLSVDHQSLGKWHSQQKQVLATYQLPTTAVLAGIQELHGVLLCTCDATGALLACHLESDSSDSREGSAVCVPLTSTRSPYIDAFAVTRRSAGADFGTAVAGSILLSTPAGVLACPFLLPPVQSGNSRQSQSVVKALRAACGGDGRRHPLALIRNADAICENSSMGPVDTAQSVSGDPSGVPASLLPGAVQSQRYTSLAQSLGEQLTNTHRKLAAQQTEAQTLDCELLRVTALLDVLGDDRAGLQLHAPISTQPVAGAAARGVQGAPRSPFEWSPTHINCTRSVLCQFRFRREPSSTAYTTLFSEYSSGGSGTSTYLDLQMAARSLVAMRALQGRTLLCSLQSTNPATSLHCSGTTYSAHIALHPDAEGGTYTFRYTFPADGLAQLCSYRLLLDVVVEGPDSGLGHQNARKRDPSNDTLLPLLDVLLPLSDLLSVITSSAAYRSAQQLAALRHQQSQQAQSGPESGLAVAATSLHSLALPINPSLEQGSRGAPAAFDVARHAVLARWQESAAVATREQQNLSQRDERASTNPLQAAFLATSSTSSRPVAQETHVSNSLLQVVTIKETGNQIAHSAHRGLLAAVSADVHSAVLSHLPPATDTAAPGTVTGDRAVEGFNDATDAAWLPAAAQQALVAAAHLARQLGSAGAAEASSSAAEDSQLLQSGIQLESATEEVWRLYQVARATRSDN